MGAQDMEIGLTLNDTPFTRAMDAARAKMKQTVAEMEKTAGVSMDTMQRRIARSVGSTAATEHRGYSHDVQALFSRDRYPLARGMGQELVAPGSMSRDAAAAATATQGFVTSLETITKIYAVAKSAWHLGSAVAEAWAGHTKKAREELEKLPPLIRESAMAGWKLGETIRDWWEPRLFSANIRGQGAQTQYLKSYDVSREEIGGKLSTLAKTYWEEQKLAGMTDAQRQEYGVMKKYKDRIAAIRQLGIGTDLPEYKAAVRAAQEARDAELWNLADREVQIRTEAAMDAADREREVDRQRREQKLAEERKWGDQLAGIRSEIAARELTRQDRTLDAERQRIKQAYSMRIREAQEAGRGEVADALALLRDMQVGMVQQAAAAPGSFLAFHRQYIEPSGLAIGQQDRVQHEIKNLSQEQRDLLRQILDSLTAE